jgi:hypothetical protein
MAAHQFISNRQPQTGFGAKAQIGTLEKRLKYLFLQPGG